MVLSEANGDISQAETHDVLLCVVKCALLMGGLEWKMAGYIILLP